MRKSIKLIVVILVFALFAAMALGSGSDNSSSGNSAGSSTGSSSSSVSKVDYTLADETLVDNDQCVFRIVEVKDKNGGAEFTAYCENKTEDLSLMFAIEDAVVNGCAIDPFWAESVAAGKISNETISFSKNQLKEYELSSVDEFRFKLRIYDENDWLADKIVEEVFTVYPTGKNEETVAYFRRSDAESDNIILEQDGLKFVVTGTDEDSIWGYTVKGYFENDTENSVLFNWEDVSVNGIMCDPFFATSLPAHSCKYSDISFTSSSFEENGIEKVEEIEFTLNVKNLTDFMNDLFKDTITLTFSVEE